MIFAQAIYKMPEFYITFAPKVFFPAFWGQMLPLPCVSYAYGSAAFSTVQYYELLIHKHYQ